MKESNHKRILWVGKLGPDSLPSLVGHEYKVMIDDAALRWMVLKASSAKTKTATDGPLTVRFD